jgi:hypothetical protein
MRAARPRCLFGWSSQAFFVPLKRMAHGQAFACFGVFPGDSGVEKDDVQGLASIARLVLWTAIIFGIVARVQIASAVETKSHLERHGRPLYLDEEQPGCLQGQPSKFLRHHHQQQLFCTVDTRLTARFACVASGVRFHRRRFCSALQAKAYAVISFDGCHD